MSTAAFAEAQRLGHSWVGPEHGLLAILRGDPADVARRAVEDAGLDAERFERRYVELVERSDPKPRRDPTGTASARIRPGTAWSAGPKGSPPASASATSGPSTCSWPCFGAPVSGCR